MKKLNVALSVAFASLVSISQPAFANGVDGGGGAQIESAFRLRGMELVSKIANNSAANQRCSAAQMQSGLEGSRIDVVNALTDPKTNHPITGRKLDAWTIPGRIQLLQASWSNFFNPQIPHEGRSVDALILHEIYRSTGICDDENFKISDTVFQLLNQVPQQYSKTYYFSYPVSLIENISQDGSMYFNRAGVCDQPLKTEGASANCFVSGEVEGIITVMVKNGYPTFNKDAVPQVESGTNPPAGIDNMMKQATTDMPFIIWTDLQNGRLAYGLDPSNLTWF